MLRILLLILLFPILSLQAQNVPTVDRYFPPPPNAAAIAKYGEIPVNNFTGVANISIPLHTLQEGDLSVPISLNYHTGGIKVTEVASWAGLGWALSAGGSITRQVNGSIDEGGYLSNNIRSEGWYEKGNYYIDEYKRLKEENLYIISQKGCGYDAVPSQQAYPHPYYENLSTYREYSNYISKGYYDTQPDIFYLNIPGYSGKFYFNENQEPILDPFQNIKIEPEYDSAIIPNMNTASSRFRYFKITTPDGTKYYLGGEPSTGQNASALDRTFSTPFSGDQLAADQIVNSWHLVKIESVNGDYSINFTYEKQNFLDFTYNGESQYSKVFFPFVAEQSISVTTTEESVLSSIQSTHSRIDFIRKEDRRNDLLIQSDLQPWFPNPFQVGTGNGNTSLTPPKLLDQINISINGKCEKKYQLNHDYFLKNLEETPFEFLSNVNLISNVAIHDYARQRPKLTSIDQISCDSNTGETESHQFNYVNEGEEVNQIYRLPSRLSFRQDHWGYYTFNHNYDIVERDDFFPDLAKIPEATVQSGLDNFLHDTNDFYREDIKSDRSANHLFSNSFLLEKVTYPSGAEIEIETEGNRIAKMEYSLNSAQTIMGGVASCNLYTNACCNPSSPQVLNNVNIPPVNINGNNITYHTLEAKIKVDPGNFACNVNNYLFFNGLLVVKKILPNNQLETVFSRQMNVPVDPAGQQTLSFALGVDQNVIPGDEPAQWWLPNQNYKVYLYKGTDEVISSNDEYGLQLTLTIKHKTANSTVSEYPVGGRRIAKISEIDGGLTYVTRYEYKNLSGSASGVLLDFPKYVFKTFLEQYYCAEDGVPPVIGLFGFPVDNPQANGEYCELNNLAVFKSNPVFPLTSTIGTGLGYETVQVIKGETGEAVGKKVYHYDTVLESNEENLYPESWFSDDHARKIFPKISKKIGKLLKEEHFASGASDPIYQSSLFYTEKDFMNEDDSFHSSMPHYGQNISGGCAAYPSGLSLRTETLPSSYVQLTEKRETLDGLTTITEYAYRDDKEHINPTQITVSRNGDVQATTNYYPQDILENPDPRLAPGNMIRMKNRNMVNVMVKSETTGLETKGSINVIGLRQGRMLPIRSFAKERNVWVKQNELYYDNDDPFPDQMQLKTHENRFSLNWNTPFSSAHGGLLSSQRYLNHTTSFSYHQDRRLSSQLAIDAQRMSYTYDGFKRLATTQVRGAGVSGEIKSTTTHTYNIGGDNFVRSHTVFNDNNYSITKNSYRPSGLLDKTTREFYGPTLENVVTDAYVYDEFKRLSSSTNYQTGQTDFTYYPDPLNRIHTETYSDGSVTSCEYGSDQELLSTKKVIDENGNESIAYTDLLGRPIYNDRLLNGQVVRTGYDYFSFGALKQVTTPMEETYDYNYDNFGRLFTKKVPGQGIIRYTYDPFYRIKTMTDANGIVQTYNYDTYNRNTTTLVDGVLISRSFYDKNDQAGVYRGKLWKTANKTVEDNGFGPFLETEYTFDQFGRTETEDSDNHIEGNDLVHYHYDFADNILVADKTHTGYGAELEIVSSYSYDHSFRLVSEDIKVNTDPTVRLKDNRYNVKDQLIATEMYGKTNSLLQIVNYDYNGRGWLTNINDVDENGIPLGTCKGGGGSIPCEGCTKEFTASKSQSNTSEFTIIDAYGGGGKLIPLEYPYPSNQLNKFENDLKQWLTENEYTFEEINVTWENGIFQVTAKESVFEFNSLNISDQNSQKSEMIFSLPNAEDFIENNNEYCNLCHQFGYDCSTCPVWELIEACPACPDLDQQVLESLDCDNCDIGGYGVLPKQLSLKLNPELFAASNDQVIHWDATTVLYLKDSEAVGFHPAGTYVTGNPFNVAPDQSDVYLSFQLPQVIIAKDNQLALENYTQAKLEEELNALFTDLGLNNATVANRIQALSTSITGGLMDKISPFAKELTKKINKDPLTPDPGSGNLPIFDLFKLHLNYQEGHEVSGRPPQYNGNISGMTWQTGNERKRTYGFSYDDLDRLKIAHYSDWQINNTWSFDEKFSTSYNYDLDGNFTNILRRGAIDPCYLQNPSIYNYGKIDELSFTYNTQNQLEKVIEESVRYQGFKGHIAGYAYDGMGTLIADSRKGMTLNNNFLNLPTYLDFGIGEMYIKYATTGEKLRKTKIADGESTQVDYCKNIEYEDGELVAIHHSTGRIIPSEEENAPFRYQFQLTDHLGNVRILFEDINQNGKITKVNPEGSSGKNPYIIDDEEIVVVNHYYPFGMQFGGPPSNAWIGDRNGRRYDYSYNGKEFNRDFGLDWSDYGARWYDATIGRWGGVDPLAADFASWSPYNYVLGNPIRLVDPDGRSPEDIIIDEAGNVVFVSDGETDTYIHPGTGEEAIIEVGYIFADDGTPIEAFNNVSGSEGFCTNCHGTSFADGEVWINDTEVSKLIEADNYSNVDLENAKEGDIALYGDTNGNVVHSATISESDGTKKGTKVVGLGGLQTETSESQLSENLPPNAIGVSTFRKNTPNKVANSKEISNLRESVYPSNK